MSKFITIFLVTTLSLNVFSESKQSDCLFNLFFKLRHPVLSIKSKIPLKAQPVWDQLGPRYYRTIKEGVKRIKEKTLKELKPLSTDLVGKSDDAKKFIKKTGLKVNDEGFLAIDNAIRDDYIDEIVPNSIEFLYAPGVKIEPLSDKINQVGHFAVRVDNMVYEQTGTKGFRARPFKEFLKHMDIKKNEVYGVVIERSEMEKQVLDKYLKNVEEENLPYHLFLNNCIQVNCRALAVADLIDISILRETDPKLVKDKITKELYEKGERGIMKTIHNPKHISAARGLRKKAIQNRAVIYGSIYAGIPILTAAEVYFGNRLKYEILDLITGNTSQDRGNYQFHKVDIKKKNKNKNPTKKVKDIEKEKEKENKKNPINDVEF